MLDCRSTTCQEKNLTFEDFYGKFFNQGKMKRKNICKKRMEKYPKNEDFIYLNLTYKKKINNYQNRCNKKSSQLTGFFIYNKWILVQIRKLLRIYLTHNRIYFFIDIFSRRL